MSLAFIEFRFSNTNFHITHTDQSIDQLNKFVLLNLELLPTLEPFFLADRPEL